MSNAFKVIDYVTKETTRLLHEKCAFIGMMDKQYDPSFKDSGGGKKGATIRVRRPNQYTVRTGMVMNVQDQDESSDTFTVATVKGVDMKFNHQELVQSVNSDGAFDNLSSKYIEPAISRLAAELESEAITFATKATYNVVGSAGSGITTLATPGYARARLNQCLAPTDGRAAFIDSVNMANLVSGVAGYFSPQADVGKAFREGFYARTAMADWYESNSTYVMRNGDDVAGAIDEKNNTNLVQGCSMIHMDTLGTTLYAGQVFSIVGIYDCHPETKAPYPHQKQFTVTVDAVVGSNECDVYFSPAIYTTGPKKNVCTATGADLTWAYGTWDDVVVNFIGNATTSYIQPLMFQREAFQFCTMDLPLMADANMCQRKVKDGISMRVWQGSDIINGELLMRIDILYGMAALNPNFACRMIGSANA
jgi:hypothetical protein